MKTLSKVICVQNTRYSMIQQQQRHGPVNKKIFRASTISASPYITWPKLDRHRLCTELWRESWYGWSCVVALANIGCLTVRTQRFTWHATARRWQNVFFLSVLCPPLLQCPPLSHWESLAGAAKGYWPRQHPTSAEMLNRPCKRLLEEPLVPSRSKPFQTVPSLPQGLAISVFHHSLPSLLFTSLQTRVKTLYRNLHLCSAFQCPMHLSSVKKHSDLLFLCILSEHSRSFGMQNRWAKVIVSTSWTLDPRIGAKDDEEGTV